MGDPRVVWKYRIDQSPNVHMPRGAKVVLVGNDASGHACVWAEVDPGQPREPRMFAVVGTGVPVAGSYVHVGSHIALPWVWHVYEVTA